MKIFGRDIRYGGHCKEGVQDFIEQRGENWKDFFPDEGDDSGIS